MTLHSPFTDVVTAIEEIRAGRMVVVVDDEDLEKLPLTTTHAVEILDFVERKSLPPGTLFVKQAYYFEPEETGRKHIETLCSFPIACFIVTSEIV